MPSLLDQEWLKAVATIHRAQGRRSAHCACRLVTLSDEVVHEAELCQAALMIPFGKMKLAELHTGWQRLDGGAMFGVVPRPLWEKQIAPDQRNRIPLALRCLYVEVDDRRIVIDTGIGEKFSDKQNDIYGVEPEPGGITGVMQRQGLDPDKVTDVVLTHLHFDHAGGATSLVDGVFVPSFRHATYYVQKRALAWAQHPTEKDRASYRQDDWQALLDLGRLRLVDGPCELFPSVSIIVSEGHTVAQQLVLLDGGDGNKLLYCGDVIPTASHIPLPYIMGYDLYPLTTLEEKKALLGQAAKEGWWLYYEHDPKVAATRVNEERGKYVRGEVLVFS